MRVLKTECDCDINIYLQINFKTMEIFAFFGLFIFFIAFVGILIPLIAIIDILRSKFDGNDNILMMLLVIFIPFGAIIYFIIAPSRKLSNY